MNRPGIGDRRCERPQTAWYSSRRVVACEPPGRWQRGLLWALSASLTPGLFSLLALLPTAALAAPGDLIRRIVSPEVQPGVNFGEVIAAGGNDIVSAVHGSAVSFGSTPSQGHATSPSGLSRRNTAFVAEGVSDVQSVTGTDGVQAVGSTAIGSLFDEDAPRIDGSGDYVFETLEVPGGRVSIAYDINNNGSIVGNYVLEDGGHGFLFDGVSYTPIDSPDGRGTRARGINDRGEVVGDFAVSTNAPGGITWRGFRYDGVTYSVLDFPEAERTHAAGINDSGQIVGGYGGASLSDPTHGFALENGEYTSFDFPGSRQNGAYDVNDLGIVAGTYFGEPGFLRTFGYLFDGNDFTTVHVPGMGATGVNAINNTGQVAGYFVYSTYDGGIGGFVYDGTTYTLIGFPGAVETIVYGMNDRGQLVGGYVDPLGGRYAFLATPVPEPSTVVLGVFGFLFFSLTRRPRSHRTIMSAQHGFGTVPIHEPLHEVHVASGLCHLVMRRLLLRFPLRLPAWSRACIPVSIKGKHSDPRTLGMAQKTCKAFFLLCGILVWVAGLADVRAAYGTGPSVFLGSTPYHVETIDVPGASRTFINDINNQGQVVGTYVQDGIGHGFLFDGNTFTTLDFPDGTTTLVNGINDDSEIVGSYASTQLLFGENGFMFDGDYYIPRDVPDAILTVIDGINNNGDLVGSFTKADGRHGFVFDGSAYVQIDGPNADLTEAADINNNGTVVGRYFVGEPATGTFTGFVYELGTATFVDVQPCFTASTSINGINNLGHLVGTCSPHPEIGGFSHGFVLKGTDWEEIWFPGARGTFVTGINDSEVIAGSYVDQQGQSHSFIATPVPEPPGVILVLVSVAHVLFFVRRLGMYT